MCRQIHVPISSKGSKHLPWSGVMEVFRKHRKNVVGMWPRQLIWWPHRAACCCPNKKSSQVLKKLQRLQTFWLIHLSNLLFLLLPKLFIFSKKPLASICQISTLKQQQKRVFDSGLRGKKRFSFRCRSAVCDNLRRLRTSLSWPSWAAVGLESRLTDLSSKMSTFCSITNTAESKAQILVHFSRFIDYCSTTKTLTLWSEKYIAFAIKSSPKCKVFDRFQE